MQLRSFGCANYKAFRDRTAIEVCPLTVFIGRNNSGKSALLRLPRLLLRALSSRAPRGAFPLDLDGLAFGRLFRDVVHGGAPHGAVSFDIVLDDDALGTIDLSATVQNVQALAGPGDHREFTVVSRWETRLPKRDHLDWIPAPGDVATYQGQGAMTFRGLLPEAYTGPTATRFGYLDPWRRPIDDFEDRVTHLGPLRASAVPTYETTVPIRLDLAGTGAMAWLMHDKGLQDRVGEWFRTHLDGWHLTLAQAGSASHCLLRRGSVEVNLCDAGQGIQQVLPIVVQQLSDKPRDHFLHMIEQPELHLHAAAHPALADLFIDTARHGRGAVLVETHSENLLLRLRRRIAEGMIDSSLVSLWWVAEKPEGCNTVQRIRIDADGEVDTWPQGVFSEGYEEVKAMRRAAQHRGPVGS